MYRYDIHKYKYIYIFINDYRSIFEDTSMVLWLPMVNLQQIRPDCWRTSQTPLGIFMFFSDLGIWGFNVYIYIFRFLDMRRMCESVDIVYIYIYLFTYSYVSIIYRCKSQTPMLFLHKKQLDLTVPTTRTWTPWGQLGHCCAKSGITHGGDRMTTGCVVLKVVNGPWRGYLPTNELYELYIRESISLSLNIYIYKCIFVYIYTPHITSTL